MSISPDWRATSAFWSLESLLNSSIESRRFTSMCCFLLRVRIDLLSRCPDFHLSLAAADCELADVFQRRRLAEQHETRRLGDEERVPAALRQALHARGRVHRVADDRVLQAVLRADVAGHEQPAVDADAHRDRLLDAALAQPHVYAREALAEHLLR